MASKTPDLSIIVPIYNTDPYLQKCLDTLAAQAMDDLEIILVDDCSTDCSGEIAEEYVQKYPDRFVYLKKENGDLSSSRNFGVKHAHGLYIGFVDSDDFVEPGFCKEMYEKALEDDADVVCCSYTDVFSDRYAKRYYNPQFFDSSVRENPRLLIYANSFAWNKIYRLSFWKENGFAYPEGFGYGDSALTYNVMLAANKVSLVNYPFYYYRRNREESITRSVDSLMLDIFKSTQSIVDYYRTHGAFELAYNELEHICLQLITTCYNQLYTSNDKKQARKFVAKAFDFLDSNFPTWRKNSYMNPAKGDAYKKLSKFVQKHRWLCIVVTTMPTGIAPKLHKIVATAKNVRGYIGKKRQFKKRQERSEKIKEKKRFYIRKNGMLVLRDVQEILAELDIVSFADFGTCLGLVREGKMLEHDLDVDIGVIAGAARRNEIRIELEKRGYKLWRQYVFDGRVVEESYRYYEVKIDLNYYEITENYARTWLFYTKPDFVYDDKLTRHIVRMDYSPITGVYRRNFEGVQIVLPQNPERLLEEKYGPNWRIPDTDWIYWRSPAATPLDSIGRIISYSYHGSVRPNEKRDLTKPYAERSFEPLP